MAKLQQQFLEAGRAYDEGRMPDAVRLYEDLIRKGHTAMEVYFNVGNAHFKGGRLGLAVLNYRKAWRLAPRDPAIGTNVRFAFQATGAAEAELSGPEIVFTNVSEREWVVVAMAAWWTTCMILALAILSRDRRKLLVPVAAVVGFVTVSALIGIWTWHGFERNPELVVLSKTQNALSAPQATSTPHFPLPEGSVVRASAHQGEWVEVHSGQLTGWINQEACAPVLLTSSPE